MNTLPAGRRDRPGRALLAALPASARAHLALQLGLLAPLWFLHFIGSPYGAVAGLGSLAFALLTNLVAAVASAELAEARGLRAGRAARILIPPGTLAIQLALTLALVGRADGAWWMVGLGVVLSPLATGVAVALRCSRESWSMVEPWPAPGPARGAASPRAHEGRW